MATRKRTVTPAKKETPEERLVWERRNFEEKVARVRSMLTDVERDINEAERWHNEWLAKGANLDDDLGRNTEAWFARQINHAILWGLVNAAPEDLAERAARVMETRGRIAQEQRA